MVLSKGLLSFFVVLDFTICIKNCYYYRLTPYLPEQRWAPIEDASSAYAFFSLFLVSFSARASSFAMRSAPNHLKVIGQMTPAKITMRK